MAKYGSSLLLGLIASGLLTLHAAAQSPAFISTGSTTVPRFAHTATLLNDGRVLIAGGAGVRFRNGVAGAEIYDPAANTFSPAGNMIGARGGHTATLLADGRVLIAGGYDGGKDLASAEIFDPVTGTFTATGDMITAKEQHTATLLRTGKVLISGGFQYRGSELYDPATGAFTPISDADLAGSGATATRLNDGTVLTVGGSAAANAALFDPISETFRSIAFAVPGNPLGNLQYHAATLLANGKVLISGGATNNDDFAIDQAQLYDATSGTFQTTGSMLPARISHTATLLPSGSVLIAGGFSDASVLPALVELYNPAAGTFDYEGPMTAGRSNHSATLLRDGSVLIVGGVNQAGQGLSTAELYVPLKNPTSACGKYPIVNGYCRRIGILPWYAAIPGQWETDFQIRRVPGSGSRLRNGPGRHVRWHRSQPFVRRRRKNDHRRECLCYPTKRGRISRPDSCGSGLLRGVGAVSDGE